MASAAAVARADTVRVCPAARSRAGEALARAQAFERERQQVGGRRDEADHDRRQAQQGRQPSRCALEPARADRRRAAVSGVAKTPPAMAFDRDQDSDQRQGDQSDLGGSGQVGARHPGRVDGDSQGLDAQEFGSADVVQGFQQHEAQADGDGGPRQWQGHMPEGAPGSVAQQAGRFHQMSRLAGEHAAGGQVDVGIQHEGQQHDGARQVAQIGQTEFTRAGVAQQGADGLLDGTDGVQDVQVGIGHDIGRHGQRQQQRPGQDSAAGEIVGRDQPGRTHAQRGGQQADPAEQGQGLDQRAGQHELQQMTPMRARTLAGLAHQRQDRRQHAQRCEDRSGMPRPGLRVAVCRHGVPITGSDRSG